MCTDYLVPCMHEIRDYSRENLWMHATRWKTVLPSSAWRTNGTIDYGNSVDMIFFALADPWAVGTQQKPSFYNYKNVYILYYNLPALGPTQPPIQWVPGLSRG
jgi:hypothetical protein